MEEDSHKQIAMTVHTLFYFLHDKMNSNMMKRWSSQIISVFHSLYLHSTDDVTINYTIHYTTIVMQALHRYLLMVQDIQPISCIELLALYDLFDMLQIKQQIWYDYGGLLKTYSTQTYSYHPLHNSSAKNSAYLLCPRPVKIATVL